MWHSEDINTILKRLESRLSGLSSKEAEERIKKYGYNEIYIPKRFRRLKIFLRQFESILVWMLIISTVVSFAIGEVNDAIAIAVIVALNATLGFIQEYRAEKAVEALKRMAAPKARVLRDGKEVVVPAREVVPGDILLLQAGDKVVAASKFVDNRFLSINVYKEDYGIHVESNPLFEYDGLYVTIKALKKLKKTLQGKYKFSRLDLSEEGFVVITAVADNINELANVTKELEKAYLQALNLLEI